MTAIFLTAAYSYLLGSIPFGYILVRVFRGQDVRATGSGNIGATNVSRTSPALGAATLILDACKGAAPVLITRSLFPGRSVLTALAAFMAIAGHIFPVWLKFRGGKGVATGLGSFAVLIPRTVLAMAGIFVAILLAFRYVSLASILTVALFPLVAWALHPNSAGPRLLLALCGSSLLIIWRHHENIRRLMSGSEPRFRWRKG
jgi:acyl phosphate:glycerol-3-phosphate acyltransferase